MKPNSILVVSFCSLVLLSFYIGGVYGFSQGFALSIGATSPSDTAIIAQVLKRLNENQIEPATKLIETHLDSKILEHYTITVKGKNSIFNILYPNRSFFNKDGSSFKLMRQTATYRSKHLSSDTYSETNRMIREAVKYYLSE